MLLRKNISYLLSAVSAFFEPKSVWKDVETNSILMERLEQSIPGVYGFLIGLGKFVGVGKFFTRFFTVV